MLPVASMTMPSSSSMAAGDEGLSRNAWAAGQSSFTLQMGQFEDVASTHPWQSGQL
jgi:hypothetical protein